MRRRHWLDADRRQYSDRWLAEWLLSGRVGQPQLTGPYAEDGTLRLTPPDDWLGPIQSCGPMRHCPILADLGYHGTDWCQHWRNDYACEVLTLPVWDRHHARAWFSGLRQAVETALATLCDSSGLRYPQAHTTWGLLTRIGAKLAACNVGIHINRSCGRPDLALATLID